jgi:polysaccharide biosynthesis/export protein
MPYSQRLGPTMLCPRISIANQPLRRRGFTSGLFYFCAQRWIGIAVAACGLLAGCRTPIYTTRSLPIEYQAPLVSPHSNIVLESASVDDHSPARIGPGDLLAISISTNDARRPAEPLSVQVASDGTVVLPETGKLIVGGLDPGIARDRIATALIDRGISAQPSVEIAITMRGTCHINVAGAVARPGMVELSNGSNDLAAALRGAGGLSDIAGTQVEVVHRDSKIDFAVAHVAPVDKSANSDIQLASLTENTKSGPAAHLDKIKLDLRELGTGVIDSPPLEDGDTITVLPQEKRTFRIEGLTKTPADIDLKVAKDTHVLDGVEMAGAKPSQLADLVFVIRKMPKMEEPIIVEISLARAKHDDDENLRLAEGDIVLVRRTMSNMVGGAFGSVFHVPRAP